MADAIALGAIESNLMRVRLPPRPPAFAKLRLAFGWPSATLVSFAEAARLLKRISTCLDFVRYYLYNVNLLLAR